jgi:iron complex outermembrane receptor protein
VLFDDLVDYTVGAFYMDRDGTLQARVDLPYTAFDFIHGPDPTPSTTQAVFVDVQYHPTDRIDLSGGLRYSEDEKDYTFHRSNPDGSPIVAADACLFPPWISGNPINCAVAGGGGVSLDGLSANFASDRVDYRAAASFDVTENIMAYVQTSTGYKGGGIDARPFVPDQAVAFGPEVLTAYEVGVKSMLWDNRIRLNGAYFFNQYEDIQLIRRDCSAISASATCLMPFNGGNADVSGFEAEVEARLTDALMVDASVSTLDFEYTELLDPSALVTDDMITPYTPELAWSVGVQYEIALPGDMGTLTPRFDANYQSEVYSDAINDATNLIDEHTIGNVRLTWRAPDGEWSVSVAGTNIFEEYYYVTKNDLARDAGFVYAQPGRPQEWAVTVKRNF